MKSTGKIKMKDFGVSKIKTTFIEEILKTSPEKLCFTELRDNFTRLYSSLFIV